MRASTFDWYWGLGSKSMAASISWTETPSCWIPLPCRFAAIVGSFRVPRIVPLPSSRGPLEGNGTIRGTLKEPTIAANLHGNGIQHEGVSVHDIDAAIDFDPNPQYQSKVDARIHNLAYKERTLDNLTFKLNGRSSNYDVRLDAKALGMSMAAMANGPFNNGAWQGQLRS